MKTRSVTFALTFVLGAACSVTEEGDLEVTTTTEDTSTGSASGGAAGVGGSGGVPTTAGTGAGTSGDPLDFADGDDFDEDATVDDTLDLELTGPLQLTPEDASLVDMTGDNRVVFSGSDGVYTQKVADGAPARKAASATGEVRVRGRTVLTFSDIDYDLGVGNLVYWTPMHGRRTIGMAGNGADDVAVRDDDEYLIVTRNHGPMTMDIVLVSADKTFAQVLADNVGRGDETTCAPTVGFSGDDAIVAACDPGSLEATLTRFAPPTSGDWNEEELADDALNLWVSDPDGDKLLYLDATGTAYLRDGDGDEPISDSVNWAVFGPQGNNVFFTVADQLRRSDLSGTPIPIVVSGFGDAVAWSQGYDRVIYSEDVTFDEAGEKRDLYSTTTDFFNATPTQIVGTTSAQLTRSVLTRDDEWVLYLTEVDPELGGTLHVRAVEGPTEVAIPGVGAAVAGDGSQVLAIDNLPPPNTFPVIVDLKLIEPGTGTTTMFEAGIVEGDVQIRTLGDAVVFRREGDSTTGGIWARPLPTPSALP